MLNNPAARKVAAVIIDPPAKLLVRMKVSPDAVTLTGTIGGSLSMLILIPQGEFIWAFVLGVFFGLSDLLDGTMARMPERADRGETSWTQPSIGSPTVPSSRHWCCGE